MFAPLIAKSRATTAARTSDDPALVSEIPLETPRIEDLIALAKTRKLPLDELRYHVMSRLAGVDQKQEPQKYIAEVNRWKHLLDLVDAAAPRP